MLTEIIKTHCEGVQPSEISKVLEKFYGWVDSRDTIEYLVKVIDGQVEPSDVDAQLIISSASRINQL